MARTVTMIPQTINPLTHLPNDTVVKRRVAGYARVSTEQEEQQTSYAAQVDYYTKYIKKHGEWEFVKVYTDVYQRKRNEKKNNKNQDNKKHTGKYDFQNIIMLKYA